MVDIQPVQDIFGLGRLAQSIRQDRLDDDARLRLQQQGDFQKLQQLSLVLGIQEKQGKLSDLAAGRSLQSDFQSALSPGGATQQAAPESVVGVSTAAAPVISKTPGIPGLDIRDRLGIENQPPVINKIVEQKKEKSQTQKAIEFWKTRNPQQAQQLINDVMKNAGDMAKFNAQGAVDFVNKELGVNWILEKEDNETMLVDMKDKKALINKADGSIIKEFPITQLLKQLTPQQEAFSKLSPEEQAATFQKSGRTIRSLPGGGFEIIEGKEGAPTKGRTQVDKDFGTTFIDWRISGGSADSDKQISQLETALSELRSGKNLTGPVIGSTPTKILGVTNPDAINTKELVEEVVQRNLRLVLGAQFTEKEGERLIARAYNQNLEEDVNARRVELLLTQMKKAAQAKDAASDYFAENGTLTGFKGKIYKLSDFKDINFEAVKPGEIEEIPSELPVGSKFIGSKGGKKVFETPDGKRFIDTGE